ncbi:MAG: isochorismatase family cysteine hydrolase, partial [Oscillospiraceae bacterium]
MKKLLVVVDMQKDFIDGSLGTKEAVKIVPRVAERIKEFKELGFPVVFTRDTHPKDYLLTQEGKNLPVAHCIESTEGWGIYENLPIGESKIFNKNTFGSVELGKFVAENHF